MAEPTLQQLFGAGAAQTDAALTISKVDLAGAGLEPTADNTAESLLVAILLIARTRLTEANQQSNPEQNITVTDSFESLVPRNGKQYRQTTLSLNLQREDTGAAINPMDY